jgi:hypothetical protein
LNVAEVKCCEVKMPAWARIGMPAGISEAMPGITACGLPALRSSWSLVADWSALPALSM